MSNFIRTAINEYSPEEKYDYVENMFAPGLFNMMYYSDKYLSEERNDQFHSYVIMNYGLYKNIDQYGRTSYPKIINKFIELLEENNV